MQSHTAHPMNSRAMDVWPQGAGQRHICDEVPRRHMKGQALQALRPIGFLVLVPFHMNLDVGHWSRLEQFLVFLA